MVKIMEWKELEALWQQYDARIAENTRINKEVLKRIIRKKPERRLNRLKRLAISDMVGPLMLVICIVLVPNIKFRNEWDFYLGLFLLIPFLVYGLYGAIKCFLIIRDIDFVNPVVTTKKQLIRLEELVLKRSKLIFLSVFLMIIGIYLMSQFVTVVKHLIMLSIFIVLLLFVVRYIHLKWFKGKMNRFYGELDEIEQLEKE
jgi:hypothetical protein